MKKLLLAIPLIAGACAAQLQIIPATPTLPNATVGAFYQQDIDATGGTGDYHWTIVAGSLPPGLTLADFSSATDRVGRISGTPTPTTATSFTFTIMGTDQTPSGPSGTRQYTITVQPATGPQLQISPNPPLVFTGFAGGDSPGPQVITVRSTNSVSVGFTVLVDDGNNGPAPSWISVSPLSGATPARVTVVVDPSKQQRAAVLSARLRFIATGATTPVDAGITFTVTAAAPRLQVAPTSLLFAARVTTPGTLDQPIVVFNAGGGGPISFTANVVNSSPWLSVTPVSSVTAGNTPVLLRARVSTTSLPLAPGGLSDVIRVMSPATSTSPATVINVGVTLLITQDGPIMTLSQTGARITMRQGNGNVISPVFAVYDTGSAGTTIPFSVTQTSATNFLDIAGAMDPATPSKPSPFTVTANATASALPVGAYYALLTVTAPNVLNSPQLVAVVLEVVDPSAPAIPEFSPGGLIFEGVSGGTNPGKGTITISTSSTASIVFQATANTSDGAKWLSVTPPIGNIKTQNTGLLTVNVNLTPSSGPLKPGVYAGEIAVLLGPIVRTVSVTFIVLPSGATLAPAKDRSATGCTPSRVAITPLGIPGSFSVPAGWPATLAVGLADDCGTVLPGNAAQVVARFDTGDAPLTLTDPGTLGFYSATWTPVFPQANATVTLTATSGQLGAGSAQIVGGVNANQLAPPVLFDNGTVNNTNPLGGALLAPGAVASAYGQNLSPSAASPGVVPLLNTFNGTTLIVAGRQSPLYFVSGGQVNLQIPSELAANQQYAVAAQINNAYAVLPNGITVIPATPGVSSFPDGHIIAQHADFTLVDGRHPAKPGESIVTYLSGMGLTTPPVASGQPAPLTKLLSANIAPTLTVDGQNAAILFAGLTPGGIGLFQINFTVPANARSGDLDVVITQNGIQANVTKLPVAAQ